MVDVVVGPAEGMRVVRHVVVQCVLYLGRKSFSHSLNILERYVPYQHLHSIVCFLRFPWVKSF